MTKPGIAAFPTPLIVSFALIKEADLVESAVEKVLDEGYRTYDIMSEGKTKEEALKNINDAIMLYLQDVEKEAKEKKAITLEVQV